jgi:hypothetical protein
VSERCPLYPQQRTFVPSSLAERSVELLVQPDAHDVVGLLAQRAPKRKNEASLPRTEDEADANADDVHIGTGIFHERRGRRRDSDSLAVVAESIVLAKLGGAGIRAHTKKERPLKTGGSCAPGSYLRTSSAVARNVCGIVRPSAAAVLTLMASSNLVGCSTGMSPGFVPRRILSTISAAFRNRSG